MQEAVTEPETHRYPVESRAEDFREAVAATSTCAASTWTLTPTARSFPAIGAKEAIFNLNLAFLDPATTRLPADPGYPVYTGGPWLAGAAPVLMALDPERGFAPDLGAFDVEVGAQGQADMPQLPNNPTGAVEPEGFFEEVVDFARANDILVVHDMAYSEIGFDGDQAPSFLVMPGAKDVGIEVYSGPGDTRGAGTRSRPGLSRQTQPSAATGHGTSTTADQPQKRPRAECSESASDLGLHHESG